MDPAGHETPGSKAKNLLLTGCPASSMSSHIFSIAPSLLPHPMGMSDIDESRLRHVHAVGLVNGRGTLSLGILNVW